jgi:hypothetical protein
MHVRTLQDLAGPLKIVTGLQRLAVDPIPGAEGGGIAL